MTTGIFTLPTTIDSTGTTDVSSAVQAWVNSVPDGSVLSFRPGTYLLAGDGILLDGRNNLIFEGNGATLLTRGSGIRDSGFVLGWGLGGNSHITIQNFTIRGDNLDGGTVNAFHVGQESSEGLASYRNETYIEFANNFVEKVWGHGLYFGTDGHPTEVAQNVWIHDNHFGSTGLYGVVFAKMDTAWVEGNLFTDTGGSPLGFEDGVYPEFIRHVYMGHNTLTDWFWTPPSIATGHAIVGDGSTNIVWDDIVIDSNVINQEAGEVNSGGSAGLISFWGTDLHTNIRITNNTATFIHDGWAIRAQNAPGIVVTGNTIPLGPNGTMFVCAANSCPGAVVN